MIRGFKDFIVLGLCNFIVLYRNGMERKFFCKKELVWKVCLRYGKEIYVEICVELMEKIIWKIEKMIELEK